LALPELRIRPGPALYAANANSFVAGIHRLVRKNSFRIKLIFDAAMDVGFNLRNVCVHLLPVAGMSCITPTAPTSLSRSDRAEIPDSPAIINK
jgi:hypothetical protein